MNGRIGSGKTTRAKQIAIEKNAALFSIDHHVQPLGQPITNAQEYEKYNFGVRDIIAELALQNLKLGTSVVFDFGGSVGHRDWLRSSGSGNGTRSGVRSSNSPMRNSIQCLRNPQLRLSNLA